MFLLLLVLSAPKVYLNSALRSCGWMSLLKENFFLLVKSHMTIKRGKRKRAFLAYSSLHTSVCALHRASVCVWTYSKNAFLGVGRMNEATSGRWMCCCCLWLSFPPLKVQKPIYRRWLSVNKERCDVICGGVESSVPSVSRWEWQKKAFFVGNEKSHNNCLQSLKRPWQSTRSSEWTNERMNEWRLGLDIRLDWGGTLGKQAKGYYPQGVSPLMPFSWAKYWKGTVHCNCLEISIYRMDMLLCALHSSLSQASIILMNASNNRSPCINVYASLIWLVSRAERP